MLNPIVIMMMTFIIMATQKYEQIVIIFYSYLKFNNWLPMMSFDQQCCSMTQTHQNICQQRHTTTIL